MENKNLDKIVNTFWKIILAMLIILIIQACLVYAKFAGLITIPWEYIFIPLMVADTICIIGALGITVGLGAYSYITKGEEVVEENTPVEEILEDLEKSGNIPEEVEEPMVAVEEPVQEDPKVIEPQPEVVTPADPEPEIIEEKIEPVKPIKKNALNFFDFLNK